MDKTIQHQFKYFILSILSCFSVVSYGQSIIIDHNCTNLNSIPLKWIDSAKAKLHIAYGHTSHGSQLISGMDGLRGWKGDQYAFSDGGIDGALDLHDGAMPGDLGNPDFVLWAAETRNYLDNSSNDAVNVIIWSWCGQVSWADSGNIKTYLDSMTALENIYPSVKFVYMTGHLNGDGIEGNTNLRNNQIRNYCRNNNKVLYDFADIESYDPDGNYYLDKMANDNCDYDSDNDGVHDRNWALDWQGTHTLNVDWYACSAAHSQDLNGNLKAYAAWWLWASLAGWNGTTDVREENLIYNSFELYQNYPNPFNPTTHFKFRIPASPAGGSDFGFVSLKVYDVLGNEVAVVVNEEKPAGLYQVDFDASGLSSGTYFYQLRNGNYSATNKMLLIK